MNKTVTTNQARVTLRHPALAMLSLMIGAFVGMFSETSLNIALPSLMRSLQVSQGTVQWLVTGYMLVISVVMPLSSVLSKKYRTKRLVVFALLAFMIGSAISACGSRFAVVLIGRMIQGLGTGIILPLMFAVAMQIFPLAKLGTVNGLAALVIMFAPAIGPTITGVVLSQWSWQAIFWLFIPLLLVALILTTLFLEDVFTPVATKLDWWSVLTSLIGFGGIVVGTSWASDAGWLAWSVWAALLIGALGLGCYGWRQLHLTKPILNLRVFQTSAFSIGTVIVMLSFGVILAAMYLLPLYLQNGLGLAVATAGVVMLPGGLVNAAASALAGRLFDKYGAKWLSRGGFVIALLGLAILLTTNLQTPLWVIIAGHMVLMVGAPLALSPAQTYALSSLPAKIGGDGSAVLNTLEQVVGAVATAIATSLMALGSSRQTGAAGISLGVHYGLWFVVILAGCALLASCQLKRTTDK